MKIPQAYKRDAKTKLLYLYKNFVITRKQFKEAGQKLGMVFVN